MAHLSSLKLNKLTDNVLKLLKNNDINNVVDFIRHDTEKVILITKLSFKEVLEIRRVIFEKFCHTIDGFNYNNSILETFAILPTCFLSLDNLLQGGLRCRKITEICGLPDSGKTLLAFSILCNISCVLKQQVLYIDTKNDFRGTILCNIMKSKCRNDCEVNENMNRVKVVKIWDMNNCLSFLHSLIVNRALMADIKLIALDSLPSLVLQHKRENNNKEYFGYLNNFVNAVRRVSGEYNIPIIVINLLTRWVSSTPITAGNKDPSYSIETKRALGRYWSHIPFVSLDVTKSQGQDVTITIRSNNINVAKNSINMKISSQGIT